MSDIQTMKDMLTGLKQKKKNLEANEKIFLRVAGLNEEIEKASQDKADYEQELIEAKKVRDAAKAKKADAVSLTTSQIAEKMNAVLPTGEAVFTYLEDDEGKRDLKIGWKEGETVAPYNGLSGMQKQVFDTALANVLDANIIVLEAAELDPDSLQESLIELVKLDKQVIVNCWLPVESAPETFEIVGV